MDKIFRIQDAGGRGPWKPGFSHQWVIDRPDHDNLVPWYVEFGRVDNQVLMGEHSGAACKTLKQLRRWFTRAEYRKLLKFGYEAVMMDVNRIIAESDIQCFIGRAKPLREDVTFIRLYGGSG